MPSQTDRTAGEVDWPPELERTPEQARTYCNKFSVTLHQAISEIETELEDRLSVDDWRLSTAAPHRKSDGMPYADSNPEDPSAVVRWSMDGAQFAVGADEHNDLRDNVREIGLWIREKRKMAGRPVKTAESEFATARLPPGESDVGVVVAEAADTHEPHEVLGIDPDADQVVVEAVAKRLSKRYHPDSGEQPDREEFMAVRKARDALLA